MKIISTFSTLFQGKIAGNIKTRNLQDFFIYQHFYIDIHSALPFTFLCLTCMMFFELSFLISVPENPFFSFLSF